MTAKLCVFTFCLGVVAALAQTPAPDGTVSPEVHPDRTVTFRLRAPPRL